MARRCRLLFTIGFALGHCLLATGTALTNDTVTDQEIFRMPLLVDSNPDWGRAAEVILHVVNDVHGGLVLGGHKFTLALDLVDTSTVDMGESMNNMAAGIDAGLGFRLDDILAFFVQFMPTSVHAWIDMIQTQYFVLRGDAPFAITRGSYFGMLLHPLRQLDADHPYISNYLSRNADFIQTNMVIFSPWMSEMANSLTSFEVFGTRFSPEWLWVRPTVEWCETYGFMTEHCVVKNNSNFLFCDCGGPVLAGATGGGTFYEVAEHKLGSLTEGFHSQAEICGLNGQGLNASLCGSHPLLDNETGLGGQVDGNVLDAAIIRFGLRIFEDAFTQVQNLDKVWNFAYAAAEIVAALHVASTLMPAQGFQWLQPGLHIVANLEALHSMDGKTMLPNGSTVIDHGVAPVLPISSDLNVYTVCTDLDMRHDYPDPLFTSTSVLSSQFREAGIEGELMPYLQLAMSVTAASASGQNVPADFVSMPLTERRKFFRLGLQMSSGQSVTGPFRFSLESGLVSDVKMWQNLPDQRAGAAVSDPYKVEPPALARVNFGDAPSRVGCPLGMWNNIITCEPCSIGKFGPTPFPGLRLVPEEEACEDCPDGEIGTELGMSSCRECEAGTFSNSFVVLQGSCRECAQGTFQNETHSTACALCPPGHFASSLGQRQCDICPPGRFQRSFGRSFCEECDVGTFAGAAGSSRCEFCPVGFYSQLPGSAECQDCQDLLQGSTTLSIGSAAESMCGCAAGSFDNRAYEVLADSQTPTCLPCSGGLECAGFNERVCPVKVQSELDCPYQLLVHPQEKLLEGYHAPLLPSTAQTVNGTTVPLLSARLDLLGSGVTLCVSDDACPGQEASGDNPCGNGREGRNCGVCPVGYSSETLDGQCEKCGGEVALLPLALLLYFCGAGTFHYFWNEKESLVEAVEPILASVTIDVAIGFLQALGIFSHFTVKWPIEIEGFFKVCRFFVLDLSIMRPQCMFNSSNFGVMYIMRASMPMVLCFTFMFWWPLSRMLHFVTGGRFKKYTVSAMLNTMGMVVCALYVSVITGIVSLWECYSSPNGTSSLLVYPFQQCGTGDHLSMVPIFIAFVLIYVVGVYAALIYACVMLPRRLDSRAFIKSTRFLVFQLQPSQWWYQIVLITRAALLALVPTIAPDSGFWQVVAFSLILLSCLMAHLVRLPFNDRHANFLETLDSLCLIGMLMLALWFVFLEGDAGSEERFLAYALMVLVVIVCSAVAVFIAKGLFDVKFPDHFNNLRLNESKRQLLAIRSACTALLATSNEELEHFLHTRGTYQDFEHVRKVVNCTMLELCGLQAKSISEQRISKNSKSFDVVSHDKLVQVQQKAEEEFADGLKDEIAQEQAKGAEGNEEEPAPLPELPTPTAMAKPALWV